MYTLVYYLIRDKSWDYYRKSIKVGDKVERYSLLARWYLG